jgi:hypothetical protein
LSLGHSIKLQEQRCFVVKNCRQGRTFIPQRFLKNRLCLLEALQRRFLLPDTDMELRYPDMHLGNSGMAWPQTLFVDRQRALIKPGSISDATAHSRDKTELREKRTSQKGFCTQFFLRKLQCAFQQLVGSIKFADQCLQTCLLDL